MKPENDQRQKPAPEGAPIVREGLSPLSPACTLLASGLCCHPLSETGNGWLRYGDCDVTRRSDDPLLHPQGILALVKACGETISATAAPFWQEGVAPVSYTHLDVYKRQSPSGSIRSRRSPPPRVP